MHPIAQYLDERDYFISRQYSTSTNSTVTVDLPIFQPGVYIEHDTAESEDQEWDHHKLVLTLVQMKLQP